MAPAKRRSWAPTQERTAIPFPGRSSVGVAVLGLSGVAALPGLAEPFLLPKALAAAIGGALVLSAPRLSALPRAFAGLVGVALLVLFMTAVVSVAPLTSVLGRYPRYEGVWVLAVYVTALAAGARMRAWQQARAILEGSLAAAAVLALLGALAQVVGIGSADRVTSLLGNASELGTWGAVVAVTLATGAADRRGLAAVGFAAAASCVVLSASRGALLALLVGLVAVGVALGLRSGQGDRSRLLAIAATISGIIVAAVLVPATRSRIGGEGLASSTVAGRTWLWRDTFDLVRANLPGGVGPSNFVDEIGAFHGAGWAATVGPANPPDSPHNVLLQAMSAGGLALAVVLVVAAATWIRYARHSAVQDFEGTVSAVAAVLAGLVGMATHFTSAATVPLLALLIGWVAARRLGSASTDEAGMDPARAAARWGPVLVAGAACLVLVPATAAERPVAHALDAAVRGDAELADAGWARARMLRPWDADLWMRQAHAQVYAVQYGLAPVGSCLASTDKAADLLPRSSQVAQDQATCLYVNGRHSEAQLVLDRALAHDPANTSLLLLSGTVAIAESDWTTAESRFLTAAALRPSAPEPWTGLATVYERKGLDEQAAEARATAQRLELASS